MFHCMFKADFVTLVSLKVPSGGGGEGIEQGWRRKCRFYLLFSIARYTILHIFGGGGRTFEKVLFINKTAGRPSKNLHYLDLFKSGL